MRCIVLATDGSERASRATDFAVQLAKSMDLTLWIVNVTDNFAAAAPVGEFSRAEHISPRQAIESLSAQMLALARDRAEENGVRDVRIESRRGDVTRTIIEIAEEKQADAIVVGKRGLGTLVGLLVGSTTQKLVSLAPCVVIVVP